ncbi:hypothetical protein K466DRAFT_291954 [Polyporus arcularius HHB13444]|uniref:Cytochrome P450 n=1 Tax=Polyporus arcularius HHB13444 TaxID=1314778 RepID=A0A5C3Q842_9APHY|nr:hypothetical protein K466DRAFT_291954 [Polyporus arcularius HHB13444]
MLVPWFGVYLGYIPGAAKELAAPQGSPHRRTGINLAIERLERGYYPRLLPLCQQRGPPGYALAASAAPRRCRHDILAIVAGSGTVSSTAMSLVYCLSTHLGVYAALKAEVNKYFHPGDDPCHPRHYQDLIRTCTT